MNAWRNKTKIKKKRYCCLYIRSKIKGNRSLGTQRTTKNNLIFLFIFGVNVVLNANLSNTCTDIASVLVWSDSPLFTFASYLASLFNDEWNEKGIVEKELIIPSNHQSGIWTKNKIEKDIKKWRPNMCKNSKTLVISQFFSNVQITFIIFALSNVFTKTLKEIIGK